MGQTSVANSKVVYQRFKEIFHGPAFQELQAAGAARQRLLWASTSTKNPAYADTLYVDQLIGPETVNTMPPGTIEAFRDHGRLANTLEQEVDKAWELLDNLAELHINLDDITEQLQIEGVIAFEKAFDALLDTIAAKRSNL
ncbi:MAG TPA: transaldolase family protein, partial [Chloroflexota bacterium]|nr:transaldolase family protein [Chloroflexota bacterium]